MSLPTERASVARKFRVTPSLTFEEYVGSQWVAFDAPKKPVALDAPGDAEPLWDFPRPSELQLVRLKPERRKLLEEAVKRLDAITTAMSWDKMRVIGDDTPWEACPDVRVRWDAEGKPELVNSEGTARKLTDESAGLSGCWLQYLDLSGLQTKNLRCEFADCVHASFAGAGLKRASFAGARLHGALFTKSKVHESNFAGSNCFGVDFDGADLSMAKWVDPNLGDTGWLRHARFTPTVRNLLGAPDSPQTLANTEGYARAGDGWLPAARLAMRTKAAVLERHRDELEFLLTELDRLRQIDVTPGNWQEFYDSWAMLDDLHAVFSSSTARHAIESLFSGGDAPVNGKGSSSSARHALGMARQLYRLRGEAPIGLLTQLKETVGRKLRIPSEADQHGSNAQTTYFGIVMELRAEINDINTIIAMKEQFVTWVNGAFLSVGIGVTNYVGTILAERYNISMGDC